MDSKTLCKQFDKDEIFQIAKELGLEVQAVDRAIVVMEMVLTDIEENGIPETEECSDLMFEFLVNAEYVDEEGNVLGEEAEAQEAEKIEEETAKPKCYSFADNRDPACKRCKLLDSCMKVRITNRPPCFGLLFDRNDAECIACLESPFCKIEFERKESKK